MMKQNTQTTKQAAFTLVEVMVAMVIFSIGLLGLAGLQSLGITNNQTAFYRTIAMQQAYNMSDRMRNNIAGVDAGNYDTLDENIPSYTNCVTGNCSPSQLATFDHFEWNTNNAAQLPQGAGKVTKVGNQFLICVMWNELKIAGNPAIPAGCNAPGAGGYNPTTDFKFYTLLVEL